MHDAMYEWKCAHGWCILLDGCVLQQVGLILGPYLVFTFVLVGADPANKFDYKFRLGRVATLAAFCLLAVLPLHYIHAFKRESDSLSIKLQLAVASKKKEAEWIQVLLNNVLPEEITKHIIESGATMAEEFLECHNHIGHNY